MSFGGLESLAPELGLVRGRIRPTFKGVTVRVVSDHFVHLSKNVLVEVGHRSLRFFGLALFLLGCRVVRLTQARRLLYIIHVRHRSRKLLLLIELFLMRKMVLLKLLIRIITTNKLVRKISRHLAIVHLVLKTRGQLLLLIVLHLNLLISEARVVGAHSSEVLVKAHVVERVSSPKLLF